MKNYENRIKSLLVKITKNIIKNNPKLKISAKSRVGAEISDFLEKEFVKEASKYKCLKNPESSPDGATKNPWDARVLYVENGWEEEIWIDFKAFKITSLDSNPDVGTPDKIIKFINDGKFYLCFIHVFYEPSGNFIKFSAPDGEDVVAYFLKDISSTFRRNPKNQLQVNISEKEEYRSREKFIEMLFEKLAESYKRQIEISNKKLKNLDKVKKEAKKSNQISESNLSKKIDKKK